MKNIQTRDSALVKLVREGESLLGRVGRDRALQRALGVGLLTLAMLLLIPPWFLIPGLVFAGFSLLGFQSFGFCARSGQRSVSSRKESL